MSDHSGFTSLGTHVGDLFSGGAALLALLGRFFGFLGDGITYAGALAALVWFCIQIWRSREIQHWWNNRMQVRWAKRLVRVKQQEKIAVAKIEALARLRAARVEARDLLETAKVEAATQAVHDTTSLTTGE